MAETKDKTTQSSANTPSDKTYKIVFVRHGESQWNQENRFTGWTDVDLAPKGREEAKAAGKTLKTKGFTFDVAFTSVLTRAIHTLWEILDATELVWIPVHRSWRLNERHYGALQGLNKTETAQKHGEDMVKIWREVRQTFAAARAYLIHLGQFTLYRARKMTKFRVQTRYNVLSSTG